MNLISHSATSHRENFVICRFLPLALLAAAFLPGSAEAHYYPFYVSNQSSTTYCIEVFGPNERSSGTQDVAPGQTGYEFYSTWDWLTSSAGEWQAGIYAYDSHRGGCDDRLAPLHPLYTFCFNPYPAGSPQGVYLTIHWNGQVSLDRSAGTCDTSAARAVLGDTPEGSLDRDDFRLRGTGERVTIRLEADGQTGHLGRNAEMVLRTPTGQVLATQSGAPPLEVTTTLPTGMYEVGVAEPRQKDADAYRGPYRLRITREGRAAPAGEADREALRLVPQRNVEH